MFNIFSQSNQKITGSILFFVLVLSLCIAPLNHRGETQKVNAALSAVTVIGGPGTLQDTISAGANTLIAGFQSSLNIKEFVLDGLAHKLAQMILKSMVQSIVNWINSGFQGKPAFVTDLKQYLQDQVDQAIGEYIYEDPSLNFLCSPFQLDVKIALATSYQQHAHDTLTEAQCTLSEVSDNVEGFLNGNFADGGWKGWLELTQNPGNTPTGAFLAAETEMYARIVDEQGRAVKELDWGNGFLSFKVCDAADAQSGREKNCDITTPGSVISDQINKALGAPQDSLISADEINEIISALFSQLAQKALTGINGLLGLGGSGYSDNSYGSTGDRSYLDALTEPEETNDLDPFSRSIKNEREYITIEESIVKMIDSAEATFIKAKADNPSCVSLNPTFSTELTNSRDKAKSDILVASSSIAMLTDLKAQFDDSTDIQEQIDIITELQGLQTSQTLHNEAQIATEKFRRDQEIATAVATFNYQINNQVNGCKR